MLGIENGDGGNLEGFWSGGNGGGILYLFDGRDGVDDEIFVGRMEVLGEEDAVNNYGGQML